jgi:hypothetical protein
VLQAIVREDYIQTLHIEQHLRGRDAIRSDHNRAACRSRDQDRFVADSQRIAVAIDDLRPSRRGTAVAAADAADPEAASDEFIGEPHDTRRLTRTANSNITDDHDGNRQHLDAQQTEAKTEISKSMQGAIEHLERP